MSSFFRLNSVCVCACACMCVLVCVCVKVSQDHICDNFSYNNYNQLARQLHTLKLLWILYCGQVYRT